MISLAITLFGLHLNARVLHAASKFGRSVVYLRADVLTRTVFMVDVEYVTRGTHRTRMFEFLVKLGPWQLTNRSFYVG